MAMKMGSPRHTLIRGLFVSLCTAAAVLWCAHPAAAQDLSRYRDVAFGSTVSSVLALTGTRAGAVTIIHQRPALIQELAWRPQYALNRPDEQVEAVQQITFRFLDDRLFSVTVVYDAHRVEGLTNTDMIEAVSAVYGPATVTGAAAKGPVAPLPGTINATTALAHWQSTDHEFTLMREVYPPTFRLIGVSRQLHAVARAAEIEAVRLDKQDAPRREAERAAAEAERKSAAEKKTRATNKDEFRP